MTTVECLPVAFKRYLKRATSWHQYVVNMAKWHVTWSSAVLHLWLWILFSPCDTEDRGPQTEVKSLLTTSALLGQICLQSSVGYIFTSRTNASRNDLGFQSRCLKYAWSLLPLKYLHAFKDLGSNDFANFYEVGGRLRNWVWCWESKPSAKLLDTCVFSGDASM